jgi:hypothetical protein
MRHGILLLLLVPACTPAATSTGAETAQPLATASAPASATPAPAPIATSTVCKEGELTYLGFRGSGPPPPALYDAIKARFPDVMVYEVKDGNLGVFTAEPHSMDVRGRHEAAAAAVGWKGDVVDFASVKADCTATFHTPMPPPH